METVTETRKAASRTEHSPTGKVQEVQKRGVWRTPGALDEMERMMERMAEGFPLHGWVRPSPAHLPPAMLQVPCKMEFRRI